MITTNHLSEIFEFICLSNVLSIVFDRVTSGKKSADIDSLLSVSIFLENQLSNKPYMESKAKGIVKPIPEGRAGSEKIYVYVL